VNRRDHAVDVAADLRRTLGRPGYRSGGPCPRDACQTARILTQSPSNE
jgi:hypothetical protein